MPLPKDKSDLKALKSALGVMHKLIKKAPRFPKDIYEKEQKQSEYENNMNEYAADAKEFVGKSLASKIISLKKAVLSKSKNKKETTDNLKAEIKEMMESFNEQILVKLQEAKEREKALKLKEKEKAAKLKEKEKAAKLKAKEKAAAAKLKEKEKAAKKPKAKAAKKPRASKKAKKASSKKLSSRRSTVGGFEYDNDSEYESDESDAFDFLDF